MVTTSGMPRAPLCRTSCARVRAMGEVDVARPSITMDLYVHEFETARRREQFSDRLTAALGGLIATDS